MLHKLHNFWRVGLLCCLGMFLAACRQDAAPPPDTASAAETAVSESLATLPPTPTVINSESAPSPVSATPMSPQEDTYLPMVANPPVVTETAVPEAISLPTETAVPTPTPLPTIDFAAVQADLLAQGQALATVKIGFHVSVGGNSDGLETWMRRLDAAGVPFFLKSVDNAQPILLGQELMRASGVPHVLVFRRTAGGDYEWDLPNYNASPQAAAEIHWQQHRDAFPPELDPSLVWIETINEVDRTRSEWLAEFALETAALAIRDGFNWAAFGWASGEPEPEHWQGPMMLEFLRFAGANPDRVAIALHEYSYKLDDIGDGYPYKIGRFQQLLQIVDANQIPRPTILITEWGWTYQKVPEPTQAMADIAWASRLYAPYPSVKGAAIWYLGSGFDGIADDTQELIAPVSDYALRHYFIRSPQPATVDVEENRP